MLKFLEMWLPNMQMVEVALSPPPLNRITGSMREWRDQKLGLFDEAQDGEGSYVDSENELRGIVHSRSPNFQEC